jgi:hypothetical protein
MRGKRLLLWLSLGIVGAAAAHWLLPSESGSSAGPTVQATPQKVQAREPKPAENRWSALPERETIGKPAGELFFPHSWAPPPPRVKPAPKPAVQAPAPKPAPPPMPYRIAGKFVHDGAPHIVLAKGDSVVTVREGDRLDDGYRVEAIRADHVTLLYLPLGVREKLPLTLTFIIDEPFADAAPAAAPQASAPAADPHPAQLRWAGPKQVKAGDPFRVALKLSSEQALRAVPLQLTYDAALLEPVAVQPGDFFAEGNFTYRINPAGSIFVGGSRKESVAADAELVILTFKPIQPGSTAELKLSSVLLQGATGRAIKIDEPAAFRTAIVQ